MKSKVAVLVATMCFVLAARHAGAQTTPSLVLLPVYMVQTPGAGGSQWVTEFALRNDSSQSIHFTPLACSFPCLGLVELAPAKSIREDPLNPDHFEGRLVRFDVADLSQVGFSLRVRDISRNASSAGTELPVVRESEFRNRVVLLDVPTDSRFRHSLRIYSLDGGPVRLKVFGFDGDVAFLDEQLQLTEPPETVTTPAQAAIHGLLERYPQLRDLAALRIEVAPTTPTDRIWAFISMTNNDTQEFTTVSPQ